MGVLPQRRIGEGTLDVEVPAVVHADVGRVRNGSLVRSLKPEVPTRRHGLPHASREIEDRTRDVGVGVGLRDPCIGGGNRTRRGSDEERLQRDSEGRHGRKDRPTHRGDAPRSEQYGDDLSADAQTERVGDGDVWAQNLRPVEGQRHLSSCDLDPVAPEQHRPSPMTSETSAATPQGRRLASA